MSVLANESEPRAINVAATGDELHVELADGRKIITPLAWFPLLLHATPDQLNNWELLGDGELIHWPQIDEDLSVTGLLRGTPAHVPVITRA